MNLPFLLFACQQPVERLAYCKAAGLNCVVDVNQGGDLLAWIAESKRLGLYRIHTPTSAPAVDAADPLCLAWSYVDEPELHNLTPAALLTQRALYAQYSKPWFLNLDGSRLAGIQSPPGTPTQQDYAAFGTVADWLCQDVYPVSGWNNAIPIDSHVRCDAALQRIAGSKPRFAYVETCAQNLGWLHNPDGGRAPTPAEFDTQMESLSRLGLSGIGFFTHRQPSANGNPPWSPWNVPPEIQARIGWWCRQLSN